MRKFPAEAWEQLGTRTRTATMLASGGDKGAKMIGQNFSSRNRLASSRRPQERSSGGVPDTEGAGTFSIVGVNHQAMASGAAEYLSAANPPNWKKPPRAPATKTARLWMASRMAFSIAIIGSTC